MPVFHVAKLQTSFYCQFVFEISGVVLNKITTFAFYLHDDKALMASRNQTRREKIKYTFLHVFFLLFAASV